MLKIFKNISNFMFGEITPLEKIDRDIELNRKYISAVNYAIKEKERHLGRYLTGKEQQEIFTKIKKDFIKIQDKGE